MIDGNDSKETSSSVSNAMDSGTSYADMVTHVQAETFQMPTASDTNRHLHSSDTTCIPVNTQYGSTRLATSLIIKSIITLIYQLSH